MELLSALRFSGDIAGHKDLSAAAFFGDGDFLAIGADEGTAIQILRRAGDGHYAVSHSINLLADRSDEEVDIEGIAYSDNGRLYVVGSHSRRRQRIDHGKRKKDNRKRLERGESESGREKLFELRIDTDGRLSDDIEVTSLQSRIESDPILGPFSQIPGKENGVDIEGIAAIGDELFVGFRGPVLRGGHVPVLRFDFDKPDEAETLLINLGDRGIRDIARVSDGFLLIGGPVGNEPISFDLYHWNGEDGVEGKGKSSPLIHLGSIPIPEKKAKPEGLAVMAENSSHYDLLIVFDGIKHGAPTVFRVGKQ
jgi:hypothetical protein